MQQQQQRAWGDQTTPTSHQLGLVGGGTLHLAMQTVCKVQGCSETVYCDPRTGKLGLVGGGTLHPAMQTVCKVQGCSETVYCDPRTGKESEYCSKRHYILGETLRSNECLREGCSRSPFVDASGTTFPCCSKRCAGAASSSFVDRTFRGGTVSATDFELSVLTKMHPKYASVEQQFLQKWLMTDPAGGVSVLRILKVKPPEKVRSRNERYRQTAATNNVVRRFHGTSCSSSCMFFADLRGGPCGESECNVCSICTHGFRLRKNVGHTARQTGINHRFGHGMYFSSVSGKASYYAEGSEKMDRSGKPIRCMFMASVAVGRAFKTYESGLDTSQCPPPGYDSVIGEAGPRAALNYDEVVVYEEGAALPTFLIVYSPK